MKNKAAHLAVGVDADGKKEVLGIWVGTNEGAKFWLRVMNELKSRGVEDVLIVVCDGLTGLPAAVTACWPQTLVQTCIVHLIRTELRWVNYKDRKRVATELRKISKTRGHFPTDDALVKLLYLGCTELGRTDIQGRGGRSNYNWKLALNQFDIMFPGRLDQV